VTQPKLLTMPHQPRPGATQKFCHDLPVGATIEDAVVGQEHTEDTHLQTPFFSGRHVLKEGRVDDAEVAAVLPSQEWRDMESEFLTRLEIAT
jgi:hypothetical protein